MAVLPSGMGLTGSGAETEKNLLPILPVHAVYPYCLSSFHRVLSVLDGRALRYGYDWKRAETEKNLLRTHTTAVSSRMLYKLAQVRPWKGRDRNAREHSKVLLMGGGGGLYF